MLVLTLLIVAAFAVLYGLGLFPCNKEHRREVLLVLAVATLVFTPALMAQQAPPATTAPAAAPATTVTAAVPAAGNAFTGLIAALEATPGCLGVETARTSSDKAVIFAWFEDKAALMTWYTSATHMHAMQSVFPGHQPSGTPLQDIAEGTGPIMAIASVTFAAPSTSGAAAGGPSFTQIAIELYAPLPGGIALGGRFAPAGVKVSGLRVVTPPSPATDK